MISNKEKVLKNIKLLKKENFLKIIFTSTKTKEGIKELKKDILQIISKNEKKS